MRTVIEHILSTLYYLWFCIVFVGFHPIGVIAYKTGGKRRLLRVQQYFTLCLTKGLLITGNRVKFINRQHLPLQRPLLIITNHQSIYDIPPIVWYLRKHFPLFVAKIELQKGVPFVSYVLRNSGSALIDRQNPRQALVAIAKMAKLAHEEKFGMVIFPEGTRSRTGKMKEFNWKGIAGILKNCPDALVVPIAIQNTWKLHSHGKFAIPYGNTLKWTVLEPIDPQGRTDVENLVNEIRDAIEKVVRA